MSFISPKQVEDGDNTRLGVYRPVLVGSAHSSLTIRVRHFVRFNFIYFSYLGLYNRAIEKQKRTHTDLMGLLPSKQSQITP